MIYDTLEHMENYFQKGSPIHKALCFAQGFDTSKPDGRYEIEGDSLYALVSSYGTSPAEDRRFEAHRKYIDVQVLLEGEEKIETSFASDLKPLQEYFEPKDIIFLATSSGFFITRDEAGIFRRIISTRCPSPQLQFAWEKPCPENRPEGSRTMNEGGLHG